MLHQLRHDLVWLFPVLPKLGPVVQVNGDGNAFLRSSFRSFEAFASESGPRFYGLPLNEGIVTLERREAEVPQEIAGVVPFQAGESLGWTLKA